MSDPFTLDETDRALVNILQVAPRASWAEVGTALDINPATAARRWTRLTTAGLARVVAYPNLPAWAHHRTLAFVEVDCEPGARPTVIATLARDPRIASVTVASSGRDLYLTVLTPSLAELSALVLNQPAGVRGTRTHIVTRIFNEGARWRLDALDHTQRTTFSRPPPPDGLLPEPDRDLLAALSDARRSITDLAESLDTSVSTARRRLTRAVREGTLSFRCETAQPLTGWPVSASFWARVPPNELRTVAAGLSRLPETRLCAAVTGADNLVISLWLRSVGDSQRFEEQLAMQFPSLVLSDRTIELKAAKRMGCLLAPDGRSTGVIPVDPWSPGLVPNQPVE